MLSWQVLSQQLQQIINAFIRFIKVRRREEATIGLAAILFWVGSSFIGWFPEDQQNFIKSWHGNLIIPSVLYIAGVIFLVYGTYRIWRLVQGSNLPPVTNRPSAIKGPLAFTPADGDLFRKLGREDELKKLLGYIEDDQVCLIVLMGASGAGKTSLLRAGLTNILKDKEIKYHYWEAVPSDSGRGLLRALQESWHPESSEGANSTNQPVELKSLEELVNPSPALGESNYVIVLDQFEQLRGNTNGQVFQLLRKVARKAKPPHRITWIVAFRREFRANWSDFIIPEQERGFFPPEFSLRLFTPNQARDVISHLIQAADLSVEQKVVNNLIEAATVGGEVSSVDIGIGLLVLSEMYERRAGETVTKEAYHFAGGAEGLLTQYLSRCLDHFPDEDRETILNAMLALRNPETNQRIAEGKTCAELAEETRAEARRLKTQLERLTKRDMRLLEYVATPDGGDTRYRLPHERLISALNRLAGKLLGELEQAKLKFVNAFSAWKNNNASQYLLRGRDLRLVERNKSEIPWDKDEQQKLIFLKRSQQRRVLRQALSISLIICLIAAGWSANSQYQRYEAQNYLQDNSYPAELYDWQQRLTALRLKESFNVKRFPWLQSNTLEEFYIKVTRSTNSLDGLIDSLIRCPVLKTLTLDIGSEFYLDGLNQVSDLEPLTKLTNLKHLTLYLTRSEVKNLEPLAKLTNLDQLSLYLNPNIDNLEPLAKLTDLKHLTLNALNNNQVNSLESLARLTNLKHLTFNLGDEVNNLQPLAKLTNLDQLTLNLSNEMNLQPLAKLTNLDQLTLNLGLSSMNNLEPLAKLTNLKHLYLNPGREVNNLEPLTNLTNLKHLYLDLDSGVNLEPLAKLTDLKHLYLDFDSGVNEVNLEPLAKLTDLKRLYLNISNSDVNNLEPLAKLTDLKHLTLNLSSEVNNLEPLAKLTNLKHLSLDISSSDVNNLEPLANMTNLKQLFLNVINNSEVKSLDPLANMTNLKHLTLYLSRGEVKSLEPLAKLTSLDHLTLDISRSEVKSLDPLAKLTNLKRLALIIGNEVNNLEPLTNLTNLKHLALTVLNNSELNSLEPLANLTSLDQLTLGIYSSQMNNLEPLLKLNAQILRLDLNTEQRMSLKAIPKSVINLEF